MEKIIITGGTGFIGKHLVNKLLSYEKCSIALVSNTRNFDPRQFSQASSQEKAQLRYYTADIRNVDDLSKIFRGERADTCIHLAAKTSVADSINNPKETMDTNVNGTLNVLEACSNSSVSNFVFASSAAVYGDVNELPITENHDLSPLSPYGISKMLAENYVTQYGNFKKLQNSISLRLFNVYGQGQTSESDVITKFAKRLSKGIPPIIYGDGSRTRDFIFIDDVTDAILLSIRVMEQAEINQKAKFNSPLVLNVGTGKPTSIGELAQKMIDIAGLDLHPIYKEGSTDKGVILHSYADIQKAKDILHFVPKKILDIGLREMMEPIMLGK
jgi:UDP-glucose 4-epimerase